MQKKSTKIIATLGPSSFDEQIIKDLIDSGVDCFRLNMSHGNHGQFYNLIKLIRKINDEIAILVDLCGPKIRAKLTNSQKLILNEKDLIKVTNKELYKCNTDLFINYVDLLNLNINTRLFFSDGIIETIIVDKNNDYLILKILNNAVLENNKGVVIKGHNLNIPFISKKDYDDLLFAIENQVDFIAASYVRSVNDILELKKILDENNSNIKIISKIEHWAGLKEIFEIITNSDAIMVARGDLGVEISFELVPKIQKMLINKCNLIGIPIIVATHMLESMVTNIKPTRAEISDVSNAIIQGADVIMLSAETAVGKYPVECVKTLVKVAKTYENNIKNIFDNIDDCKKIIACNDYFLNKSTHFLTKVAYDASNELNPAFLIVPTQSGFTARMLSRFKPNFQIIALTNKISTLRTLNLSFGVETLFFDNKYFENSDKFIKDFLKFSLEKQIITNNDIVIIVSCKDNIKNNKKSYFEIMYVKDF
jgi:pyruvate kinase